MIQSLKNATHRTDEHYGKNRATLPLEMTNANGSVFFDITAGKIPLYIR